MGAALNLVSSVVEFVTRARERPTEGADPKNLDWLLKQARQSWGDSFEAQHAPLAEYTWEIRTAFPSGATAQNDRTARIPLKFPHECMVVGFIPTIVSAAAAGGLIVPTLDDVDVAIDINNKLKITNAQALTTAAGETVADNFTTLSTIGILAPRLWGLRLKARVPEIGFQFRWKRGGAFYTNSIVTIAACVRFMGGDREIENQ